MKIKIVSVLLVLALASLACGFNIDVPGQKKTGPEVKESISVADPKSDETRLTLSFGAGDMKLSPGANNLVEGTVTYNIEDLKPEVIEKGSEITIKQGNFEGLPPFDEWKNEWDLKLGKFPMALVIEAGAYKSELELGGLSLTNLTIKDGASDVDLSFAEPNLVEMSQFSYTTGASDVKMTGLGNANFNTFIFNSGAGNYTLDFSGELQQDATASIDTGLSDITLVIPPGTDAVVTVDSGLANVDFDDGWSQSGKVYTRKGEGHTLTIVINVGAGDVTVRDK